MQRVVKHSRPSPPVLSYSSLADERQRKKEREYHRRLARRQIGYSFSQVDWRVALVKLVLVAVLVLLGFLFSLAISG